MVKFSLLLVALSVSADVKTTDIEFKGSSAGDSCLLQKTDGTFQLSTACGLTVEGVDVADEINGLQNDVELLTSNMNKILSCPEGKYVNAGFTSLLDRCKDCFSGCRSCDGPSEAECDHPLWTEVFNEAVGYSGDGNVKTLNFYDSAPSYTRDGNGYWVKMEWGSKWMKFKVPAGSNIFENSAQPHIPITEITSSGNINPNLGTSSQFCKACKASGGTRWGDTCWGITDDNHRGCGCNSGGWTGVGIYYGGYSHTTRCGAWGGGFAGGKLNGHQKGGISSLGLKMSVKAI